MASESDVSEVSALFERIMRSRDVPLFLPFILGFTDFGSAGRGSPNPDPRQEESGPIAAGAEAATATSPQARLILINPFTQSMFVMDGASNFETLLGEMGGKGGQPPASKESIASLPCVEVGEGEEAECVICLDQLEMGATARKMPCSHRFHGDCLESWLKLHGSCPVCRYQMPADEKDEAKKSDEERAERRQIWLHFSFDGLSGGRNVHGDSDPSRASPQPSSDLSDPAPTGTAGGPSDGENPL